MCKSRLGFNLFPECVLNIMEDQCASTNNSIDIEYANPGCGSTCFSECANPTEDGFEDGVEDGVEDKYNLVFDGRKICKLFFPKELKKISEEDYYTPFPKELKKSSEEDYYTPQVFPKELKKISEEDYYTPQLVSFGPYYHGRPEFCRVQKLKCKILKMQISSSSKVKAGSSKDKDFYDQIFKVINKIRNCYVGVSKDKCGDGALAKMMLLDASFAAFIMRTSSKNFRKREPATLISIDEELGYKVTPTVRKDMLLVENQIPLCVIMGFFKLIFENEDDGRVILHDFVTRMASLPRKISSIPGEDEKLPLHLLDAIYRVLVQVPVKKCQCKKASSSSQKQVQSPISKQSSISFSQCNEYRYSKYNRQFRSVTDLKAKGIHFKPSSPCLNDIRFKSHTFGGKLQLPVLFFSQYSKLLFIHLVAYELHPQRSARPESPFPGAVASYVNFLKSLVNKPEDVRELRERKILFSSLNGAEKVLQVIKEISITRAGDHYELEGVKMIIDACCRRMENPLVFQLFLTYNHIKDDWLITLLTAAGVILTFLQTIYTMKYHN